MAEITYQTWWALHLRVAHNERLNAEEQPVYETGLRQLYQEEILNGDVATLRKAQAEVAVLEAETSKLHARRDKLEAEIAALEAALSERTRCLLDVEEDE